MVCFHVHFSARPWAPQRQTPLLIYCVSTAPSSVPGPQGVLNKCLLASLWFKQDRTWEMREKMSQSRFKLSNLGTGGGLFITDRKKDGRRRAAAWACSAAPGGQAFVALRWQRGRGLILASRLHFRKRNMLGIAPKRTFPNLAWEEETANVVRESKVFTLTVWFYTWEKYKWQTGSWMFAYQ